MLKKRKAIKTIPMAELIKGKGLENSLANENHGALLKTKANQYHCQKKDSDQNNSPWLKLARGRSFDNLPFSFTFTLFHNK
jgi:hypothetical protein